jgi:hypothetical protein
MFFPQHFLNLRPLPQMQGSLRPIFGVSRIIGFKGGQQLMSLQQTPSSLSIWSDDSSIFSIIFYNSLTTDIKSIGRLIFQYSQGH